MQQQAAATEGITFTATTNSPATRGEFVNVDGSYVPFWSSDPGDDEEDKISVFSNLTMKEDAANNWASTAATYKATKSQRRGEFTGNSVTDILTFASGVKADNPAQFLTIFPAGSYTLTSSGAAQSTTVAFGSSANQINLAAQTQTNTKGAGVFSSNVMYSATTGYPRTGEYGETIAGVGENLNLNFNYVLSGIAFSFKNVKNDDVDYTTYLGNMKSISLTSLGKPNADGTYPTPAEGINKFIPSGTDAGVTVTATYNAQTLQIAADHKINMGDAAVAAASTATVTMDETAGANAGLAWDDKAHAYLMVAPVERTEAEGFKVIYAFANTSFSATFPTSKSWPVGMFTNFPALDIESYPYFLTHETVASQDVYTLVVNKDGLAKAIENGNVEWDINGDGDITDGGSGIDEVVAVADIDNVVINGDMSEADWTALVGFTGIVELTLNDVTTIPAGGFAGLDATKVKKLNLPKVTTIDPNFRGTNTTPAFSILTNLNLASYDFPSNDINAIFFNEDVAGELKTLDISAVTSMAPTFNVNRTLKFEGYNVLRSVKLNAEKVVASQNAFDDCTALETVEGVLDLTGASYAFRNAGSSAASGKELAKVNVTSSVLPAHAFNGASHVKEILVGGKQIVPTEIGAYALASTAVEYMDLSKATTIGQGALALSKYTGVVKGNDLVEINVATLEDCILQSTNVVNVRFNNATLVNGRIFYNAKALQQVEFVKAFTIGEKVYDASVFTWDGTFGTTPANIDLFINAEQDYLSEDGKSLTFGYVKADGKPDTTNKQVFTFGQVVVSE